MHLSNSNRSAHTSRAQWVVVVIMICINTKFRVIIPSLFGPNRMIVKGLLFVQLRKQIEVLRQKKMHNAGTR